MKLFCDKCQINHDFKPSEVELIIYSLQADYSCMAVSNDRPAYLDEFDATQCLGAVLGNAADVEMFFEYTKGCVQSKKYEESKEVKLCGDKSG